MKKNASFTIAGLLWLGALAWGLRGADLYWDGGAGNGLWSSGLNWSTNQAPTVVDGVRFTNTYIEARVVDVDFVINGLAFDNASGRFEMTINDGVTLTVSNYLRVGAAMKSNSAVRITGPGTLKMVGDIQVSGTNTGSLIVR